LRQPNQIQETKVVEKKQRMRRKEKLKKYLLKRREIENKTTITIHNK
jgi:hypothetical protein